jgi:2-polyprenyl-3-methyl-5-hydroxy-6-metoxy-1,4-benzoquinol methylase
MVNRKSQANQTSQRRPEDMALEIGAKKVHEGRQFMYDQAKTYHDAFRDKTTGLCRAEFLEKRACPTCNGSRYALLFVKDGGTYVKCDGCGMCFLNPVFTDEALVKFYSGNNTVQSEVVTNESSFYRRIYGKGLASISRFVPGGEILDIGCSSGFFLDIAKESGWSTTGVELNNAEAAISQKKHKVYNAPIESLKFDKQFDAISLWDVFEHIKDGSKVLQLLKSRLSDRGVIFLQTPNVAALAARVLQEKCKMFDGIEHVNIYSPETMELIAKRNGLAVIHMETVISEIPVVANYLDYQDPYLGTAGHGGKVLGLIDEDSIHGNLLGYKLQVVLKPVH